MFIQRNKTLLHINQLNQGKFLIIKIKLRKYIRNPFHSITLMDNIASNLVIKDVKPNYIIHPLYYIYTQDTELYIYIYNYCVF